MDYRILGMMHERVYPRDVVELRQRLVQIQTWIEFQQSIVGEAIEQWRNRLRSCVRAERGHFEHLL